LREGILGGDLMARPNFPTAFRETVFGSPRCDRFFGLMGP